MFLSEEQSYVYAGFFSHSIKLCGLLEISVKGLWEYVSIVKA